MARPAAARARASPHTGGSPHEVVVVPGAVDLLDPDDPAWEATLEDLRHDAHHRPGYAALQARGVGRAVALRYREGGRTLLMPVVVRPVEGTDAVDATSPYGYPGPVSDAPLDDEGFWRRACAALVDALGEVGAVTNNRLGTHLRRTGGAGARCSRIVTRQHHSCRTAVLVSCASGALDKC